MDRFQRREKEIEIKRLELTIDKLYEKLKNQIIDKFELKIAQLDIQAYENKIAQLKLELNKLNVLNG